MSCGFAGSLWFNTTERVGSMVNIALQQGQVTWIVEFVCSDILFFLFSCSWFVFMNDHEPRWFIPSAQSVPHPDRRRRHAANRALLALVPRCRGAPGLIVRHLPAVWIRFHQSCLFPGKSENPTSRRRFCASGPRRYPRVSDRRSVIRPLPRVESIF